MTGGRLGTIERWYTAVNAGDAAGAGALRTPDVEVGGPRGSGFGRELVLRHPHTADALAQLGLATSDEVRR